MRNIIAALLIIGLFVALFMVHIINGTVETGKVAQSHTQDYLARKNISDGR